MTKCLHFYIIITAFITLNSIKTHGQVCLPMGPGFASVVNDLLYDSVSNKLYAVGDFYFLANGQPMHRVAVWNGTSWDSLGSGVNDQGQVHTMVMYNGDLLVGGVFNQIGGINAKGLARWDGQTWHTFFNPTINGSGSVFGLYVDGNDLYVGGYFDTINSLPANSIAKYDGVNWTTYPSLGPFFPLVSDIIRYNGNLYIGGNFIAGSGLQDIAKWDGTQWISVGGGFNGPNAGVTDFKIYQNKLLVSGVFHVAAGDPGNNIALWDDTTWTQLNNGVLPNTVFESFEFQNNLFVGGAINNASGVPVTFLAKWDGTNWSNLNFALDNVPYCFEKYGNKLIIGGGFNFIDGDTMRHITQCDLSVGIDEFTLQDEFSIDFFPIPSDELINIKYGQITSDNSFLTFLDMLGRNIKEIPLQMNHNNLVIDVSKWIPGIYFYCIKTPQQKLLSGKFIIK